MSLELCAPGAALAKQHELNASAARCVERRGTVGGLLVQVCPTRRSRAAGDAPSVTAAEEYAAHLQALYRRRRMATAGTAIRVFNFIAALSVPLDDTTLGEVAQDGRVRHLQVSCNLQLDPVEMSSSEVPRATGPQAGVLPWGLDRIDARIGIDGHYAAGAHRGSNSTVCTS